MQQKVRSIVGIVLVVALLCTGCASSGKQASPKNISQLPEYDKLSTLLGCTKEEVCSKMGWQESEVVEELMPYYTTPLTVEYDGVSFQIKLVYEPATQKIATVIYYAEFEKPDAATAKTILQITQTLGKNIGQEAGQGMSLETEVNVADFTEEQALDVLQEEEFTKRLIWDLSEAATDQIKDYMKEREETDNWKKVYGGRSALYSLQTQVSRTGNDTVYFQLMLGVIPDFRQSR